MPEKASILPLVVLVVVVVIAGGAAGAYVYERNIAPAAKGPAVVQQGDNVTVNYVGLFASGPDQGHVFDTSLYSVYLDNTTYPKALSFHYRGSQGAYSPLPVYVGPFAPGGAYLFDGQNFTQVVPGFWQGLLGLPGNESHAIYVPEALGYSLPNPACPNPYRVLPLEVKVPILQSMAGTKFTSTYPGIVATTGASFNDPTYGWKIEILSANQTTVVLENVATVGQTASLQGWPTEVTNVTTTTNGSGWITVVNELNPAQAGHISGHSASGLCTSISNGDYIITAVNYTSGTFTENFDPEVDGQDLIFVVTVINIFAPVAPVV